MGKVPKLKLQVLKVRNIVIILSKLVNGIKLRIEVYKISVIFEKYIRNKLLLVHSLYYAESGYPLGKSITGICVPSRQNVR